MYNILLWSGLVGKGRGKLSGEGRERSGARIEKRRILDLNISKMDYEFLSPRKSWEITLMN
jgi:hypothetical protein